MSIPARVNINQPSLLYYQPGDPVHGIEHIWRVPPRPLRQHQSNPGWRPQLLHSHPGCSFWWESHQTYPRMAFREHWETGRVLQIHSKHRKKTADCTININRSWDWLTGLWYLLVLYQQSQSLFYPLIIQFSIMHVMYARFAARML